MSHDGSSIWSLLFGGLGDQKLLISMQALLSQINVELAKSIANRPDFDEQDDELRKKLWMLIARHVVQEEKDIKRAMEYLQVCINNQVYHNYLRLCGCILC